MRSQLHTMTMLAAKPSTGMLVIISSPSGAGKTSIIRRMQQDVRDIIISVSVTTRKPRQGEKDGIDYRFIDIPTFNCLRDNDALLEHATVFGRNYGTPRAAVSTALESGQDVLFDIDWQGAQQLRRHSQWNCVSIFILPPSRSELVARLQRRAQDSLQEQKQRLSGSLKEIVHYKEYDYVLTNVDLNETVRQVTAIITAERLKRTHQDDLSARIESLIADIQDTTSTPDAWPKG